MTRSPLQKYIIHPLEGLVAHGLTFLTGLLPIDVASDMGGWLARTIGPHLKISAYAKDNLERAFPDKSPDEIHKIIVGMWDNLGRVGFEFAHIPKINIYNEPDRFEIIGAENVALLRDDNQCGIFFAGHMANWEICALGATQCTPSLPVHMIYREPDNPWTRSLFAKRKSDKNVLIPKGAKGARLALQTLKEGGHLALLVDQKMNDGIAVPFFGRDAMTAPAMAQFALKFNCPIIPARIERLKGATFRLTLFPPMTLPNTGDRKADVLSIMTEVNQLLESWITERPEQWLWLHRRWPKD
jgi:Kdo2-lipid IVA lauroyltransferase/acyltransferase